MDTQNYLRVLHEMWMLQIVSIVTIKDFLTFKGLQLEVLANSKIKARSVDSGQLHVFVSKLKNL